MDQNTQFFIIVGTVIAVFLWLRNDINRLDAKIDRVNDKTQNDMSALGQDVATLRSEVAYIRETLAWLRGRLGYSDRSSDESVG